MNEFYKYLYKKVLKHVLEKPCPTRIPRSGEAGKRVDCYTVEIKNGTTPHLLADTIDEAGISGLLWNGQRYDQRQTIAFENINDFITYITHYYGLYEIRSDGIISYLICKILRRPYVRIRINNLQQLTYNQLNPFRFKKIQLLEFLVEHHIESAGEPISSWDVMNDLYSIKWFGHPKGEEAHKRLRLFLDSLVTTGEIEETREVYQYRVKGKALDTLSRFELEERRHKESLSLQRKLNILTLLIAVAAILTFFDKQLLQIIGTLFNTCISVAQGKP